MYRYCHPKPIIIELAGARGYELRQKAAIYVEEYTNVTGAERGSIEEQGFGALSEMVVRNKLGMPDVNPKDHPIGYDLILPSGVKVDVKCRGGGLPFQEEYLGSDDIPREAKHNLFARQIYDEKLDTDIYLMTHLETPGVRTLPGTKRQRKWMLYICGWVSKERIKREGVYLPRGSLTEQGKTWFTYRGQEIEFYHKNLNGLEKVEDLRTVERADVDKDRIHEGDLNLTSVDAIRIAYDLIGRGILNEKHLEFIKGETKLTKIVKPALHPNQYFHLLKWLEKKGILTATDLKKAEGILQEVPYSGI